MPKRRKKKNTEENIPIPLPEKGEPGYFQALVRNCITAYEKLSNDGLALDYCKVRDKKLRAMILSDDEYKVETRNVYARQRLEEMEELEYLASLAANEKDGDEDDDHYAPRDGEKSSKKLTGADKDMINMRFKAAQMKRELRAELSKMEGGNEQDVVNMMIIPVTLEEMQKLITASINEGSDDADMDTLIGVKEEIPAGVSNNFLSEKRVEAPDEDAFDVLPDGEIVEK